MAGILKNTLFESASMENARKLSGDQALPDCAHLRIRQSPTSTFKYSHFISTLNISATRKWEDIYCELPWQSQLSTFNL